MLSERDIKLFGRDIKFSEQVNYVVRTRCCCPNEILSCSDEKLSCRKKLIRLCGQDIMLFGRDIKLL